MRRKFKYFGLVPVMLSAFLATSMVVSCSAEQEGVLSSIEVTSMPNTVEYAVGSSFRRSGLEVTAYYYGGDSKVLNSSDYTYTTPDMSTAGEKEVVISYTEDEVTCTTSFTITVYENNIVDISISDEFTVAVGDNFDDLYVPVNGTYEDGTTSLINESEYNVYPFTTGVMSTPTVGSIIAEYKENTAIYDEVKTLKFEAEDAVATGSIQQGEQSYNGTIYSYSAYANTGSGLNLGTLTFDFTVLSAGNYDISLNVSTNYVFNTYDEGGYYYDQQDLAINTVAKLKVNDVDHEIEDTAVHDLRIQTDALVQLLGSNYGFKLIRLGNVPLQYGTNSIEIELVSSTIGQVQTRWSILTLNYSPSLTIDYLRIDEADPKEIVGIEVATLPDQTSYLVGNEFDATGLEVHAVYDDGSTGLILDHTYTVGSVDTSTAGVKSVTVTYDKYDYTTSFDVTVVNEPDSIRIDTDNFSLNYNDDLSSLSVPVIATLAGQDSILAETTYTVVAKQNGVTVTGRAGFGTYTIEVTYNENQSITTSEVYTVDKFTYYMQDFTGTNLPSITSANSYGYEYMEFGMTEGGTIVLNFPSMSLPAGTFELSMDMLNLFVTGPNTYVTQDLDLSKIMTVTLNSEELTLVDPEVEGGTSYGGLSALFSIDNLFNKKLTDITLNQETEISLTITFNYDSSVVNYWGKTAIVITNFYLTHIS